MYTNATSTIGLDLDFIVVHTNAVSLISIDFVDLYNQRLWGHNSFVVLRTKNSNIALLKDPMEDFAVMDQKHGDSTQKGHSPACYKIDHRHWIKPHHCTGLLLFSQPLLFPPDLPYLGRRGEDERWFGGEGRHRGTDRNTDTMLTRGSQHSRRLIPT